MKFKNKKYVTMGLILNLISCDLLMNDEIKEKSIGLFDKVHSVLDAKVESIKNKKSTKKKRRVLKKKRPSAVANQAIVSGDVVAQDVLKNDVMLKEEAARVALSGTNLGLHNTTNRVQEQSNVISRGVQNSNTRVATTTFDSGRVTTPISRNVVVEPKKDIIVQSNLIDFDITSNSGSQIISGSNNFSYVEEIEEDEDDYYFQETVEDDDDEYVGEVVNLYGKKHNAYMEGVRYNVGKAIDILEQMHKDYGLLNYNKATMHSTQFDNLIKEKAKREAGKFTKEKLEKDLDALLNYIKVGANTATNFVSGNVYTQSMSDTKIKLDALKTRLETLIFDVKKQSNAYEAYKAVERGKIYEVKESLYLVKGYVAVK